MDYQVKMPFVITMCSGKGGVGKSVLAANLAYALAKQSLTVLVWDANMYFPNQHLLFGVEPPIRLTDAYSGKTSVLSCIYPINENLCILADSPPSSEKEKLKASEILDTYIEILKETNFDVIIIDTPAVYSEEVLQCCNISDLVCIVINDEPTSLLDAYGFIKILLKFIEQTKLNLIVNNVIDSDDADEISGKLNLATEKFMKMELNCLGFVPYDRIVRQSILRQELFVSVEPEQESSIAITKIANNIKSKIQGGVLR